MPAHSNPNGSNQWTMDPRQAMCWSLYVDPRSETFGNAMQSAIKAGYTEISASQITATEWFIQKARRVRLYDKAEKVLEKTLDDIEKDAKLAQDSAKFVAKTLGKEEYSEKNEIELTGKIALVSQNDVKARLNNLKRKK